jgi:hypothetical protein
LFYYFHCYDTVADIKSSINIISRFDQSSWWTALDEEKAKEKKKAEEDEKKEKKEDW